MEMSRPMMVATAPMTPLPRQAVCLHASAHILRPPDDPSILKA